MAPRRNLFGMTEALAGAVLIPAAAVAQQSTARVRGRVVDAVSTRGLPYAEIAMPDRARVVRVDSGGRFTLDSLPNGSLRLVIRAFGFHPTEQTIELKGGDDITRTFSLDSTGVARLVPTLPTVSVDAPAALTYRLADFERRRRTGRGHYLTDEEIRASGANTLQAAVRGLRGVEFDCRADAVCKIHMARAPNNCDPQYVVDSRVDNMFGPSTPIRDIVGLEVYSGPSDVPGEFAGRDAGCGVIVIWTRYAPARR
jgi:carboxypeptidase family protein